MSLDVAALIGANVGVVDSSSTLDCSGKGGPDGAAGLSAAEVRAGTKDAVSDLSDSGGEDDILRQVS